MICFQCFPSNESRIDKLVSATLKCEGTFDLDRLINTCKRSEKNLLARELLQKGELKSAVHIIEKLIQQDSNNKTIKKDIFNQLQTVEDIQYYDRYLYFRWTQLTGDILKHVHPLCNHLCTRESSVFSKKLQEKLGVDNYLHRSEKSLVKIDAVVQQFFNKLDNRYQSIGLEIQQKLRSLFEFYSYISTHDANLLFKHQLTAARKVNEQQKIMDKQHELIQSALNGQVSFISKQSIADIFGDEADIQIRKLATLGVRIFDVQNKEERTLAAVDHLAKVNEKLYFPYGNGFEY